LSSPGEREGVIELIILNRQGKSGTKVEIFNGFMEGIMSETRSGVSKVQVGTGENPGKK
jgi:hypothetical protein